MRQARIDAVIRLYDLAELPSLRICLLTLLGQVRTSSAGLLTEPLHIHLMTQRFTAHTTRQARDALADLLELDEHVAVTFHNWDYASPLELRIPLLNMALDVTDGRYLTVLDSADCLCPGALANLVARLKTTQASAAVGGTTQQVVRWWGDVFLPLNEDPPPTPSGATPLLLLNRDRLPQSLFFQVTQAEDEIAEFMDRLRQIKDMDEMHLSEVLCLRHIYR